MLTGIMLLIAAGLLAAGATLMALAKSGPQGTLGGVMILFDIIAGIRGGASFCGFKGPKKLRPGFGGSLAAREPVWDGEGWGCDRLACS